MEQKQGGLKLKGKGTGTGAEGARGQGQAPGVVQGIQKVTASF